MKKNILLIFCFLTVFFISFAGKFILIPVNETHHLESLFANKDLKIHYYCDDFVLATADVIHYDDAVILDEHAFADGKKYAKVYCKEDHKSNYLAKSSQSGKVLYSGNHFFIMQILSGDFRPAKNDGMVAILDTEAKLHLSNVTYPVITEPDRNILSCISQVNTENVMGYIQALEDFGTRNAVHPNHVAARNWIKEQYEAMGLEVTLRSFNWPGGTNHNVIAIQYGTTFPDEYIVLGGHYDSYTYESQSDAPGADDDASGVAGVMETARILSQYDFKYSIIYCAFSAEEYGLYGSGAYAQQCANQGMSILGYFNLDMTGYLKPGNPIHMSLIYPGGALTLADYFVNICDIYFPTIPVSRHANLPWGDSDHTSFNNKGYKGIWWFEDINCDSPYIHHITGGTSYGGCQSCEGSSIPCLGDLIGPSVNSPEQVTVFTQAMVASIATLAELDGEIPLPLDPPTNCVAANFFERQIKITWDAPEENTPDGYYVYRDSVKIFQQAITATEFYDIPDEAGEYCYHVTAVYDEIESEFSNESCAESYNNIAGYSAKFNIYPNPANDRIFIEGEFIKNVEIIDINGRIVAAKTIASNVATMDISNLTQGIYFVKISNKVVGKFVKE